MRTGLLQRRGESKLYSRALIHIIIIIIIIIAVITQ